MPKRTTVSLHNDVIAPVLAIKPGRKSLTQFLEDLIEQAISEVDTSLTLEGEPASLPSFKAVTSSSKAVSSNARAFSEKLLAEEINRNPDRPAKAKKDPFSSKRISAELVPAELQRHADLIVDFWAIKKGTRSERAWNGLVNKLNGMTPEDQGKALAAAYDGGWATIYEPKADTPTQGKWKQAEPVTNHPAHKVFKADDLGPEWDVPSVPDGKGVLEGMF